MTLKNLYIVTDNLIEQQFYLSGKDMILGRTPDISIKISKSGQIIKKFKKLLNSHLNLFLKGKYIDFFSAFKMINGITDTLIQEISLELKEKLANLEGNDIDIVIIYSITLSTLLSKIREFHFNKVLNEIRSRTKKASNISDDNIQKELDNLFMRNNKNISLLYNLAYIYALSKSFNYRKVSHTCNIQKSKYINQVVKIISSNCK